MRGRALLLALACALAAQPACGVDRRVEKADQMLRDGDYAGAEAGYRWVLEREPDDVRALYGLGWVYLQDRDPLRAREYFKRCVRVDPDDHRGYKGLGSVALSQNLLDMAESNLQDALERAGDPLEKAKVLNSLALVDMARDKPEDALVHLEEAAKLDPGRGEYGLGVAEVLYKLQRYEDALRTVDESLSQPIGEVRFRGLLLVMRAKTLVSLTTDRLDKERCQETLPPVLAYLDRADRALEQAEALGQDLPPLYEARRRVHLRRSKATEACPLKN